MPERIHAVRAAGFRAVNTPSLCATPELLYGVHCVLMGVKMKLSALEIICILLASSVAVAGFVTAANALISVI
ncbi:hypothetical protein [Ruegeria lacuscaerulensis]|uniref:hypothetical protein n=1 Tax=Ruegeria lacuscaerulensis TaxID=55218 RepID=UPI001481A713|nr:hypothetical protein [Ruegeria lacuscaerulensis]